jgi:6-phospho-beta-glucosidase
VSRLAVIGGSSPFSAALIDALAQHGPAIAPRELVLQGRSPRELAVIGDYAERRLAPLGWSTAIARRLDRALDGAEIVLHQPRYGGLELRAQGEDLCARHAAPADETLGPAALLSALRTRAAVDDFAATASRHAPEAWILNLTNPLSLVTARIARAGLRCIGLCELPEVTLGEVARVLEIPPAALAWQYGGLNHRGFLYDLRSDGLDRLLELVARLASERIGGIASETIERLHAVPLKHFRMVVEPDTSPIHRADELSALRRKIVAELEQSRDASPPSLSERYMEWYPRAVAPLLAALDAERPAVHVATLTDDDGIARETKVEVCARQVRRLGARPAPPEAQRWIDTFERHEAAVLAAVEQPTARHVERALELDPTLHGRPVAPLVRDLVREARRARVA